MDYGLDLWGPNINMFRDPRWGRGKSQPSYRSIATAATVATVANHAVCVRTLRLHPLVYLSGRRLTSPTPAAVRARLHSIPFCSGVHLQARRPTARIRS